jgi:hypothetical protein
MKTLETGCFIIIGRTTSGKPFRPSDWDHRLCGALSLFNQGKLEYSRSVMPIQHELGKAVYVDGALKESNPAMWKFILGFAEDNEMQIEWPDICPLPKRD